MKNLILILMALVVGGCMTRPRETFNLSAARVVPLGSQTQADMVKTRHLQQIQILIAPPSALKVFDGEDIVVSNGGGSVSYLAQAQLSDRLPQMVQTRLVQAFEDSSLFGGVGRPGDGLATNYQILSDIRAFGITSNAQPPRAQIEMSLKIINDRTGVVRGMQIFSRQQPVLGEGNAAYAQALERAFSAVLTDIVNWTVKSL